MGKIKILLLTSLILLQGTGQKKYSLDNHAIDLIVDNNWDYKKLQDDTYSFSFKCDKEVAFCKNIVIKIIKNTDNGTIDQLTQSLAEYIPKRFKQYEIISIREGNINERLFKVIDYKFKENGIDLGSTILVTQRNDEFIAIYFTALNQPAKNYVNERKLLFEILKSLDIRTK